MSIVLRTEGPKVDLFVEQGDLPEVPLSQLRNGKYSVQRQKAVDPELLEGPPTPVREPAQERPKAGPQKPKVLTGPPAPGGPDIDDGGGDP
jgi:hypothetical protein